MRLAHKYRELTLEDMRFERDEDFVKVAGKLIDRHGDNVNFVAAYFINAKKLSPFIFDLRSLTFNNQADKSQRKRLTLIQI